MPTSRRFVMQYALMIYTEPGLVEALSDTEREAVRAEYAALADDPRSIDGVQLQPVEMATSVRVAGGRPPAYRASRARGC
jgi:hypothetical protein